MQELLYKGTASEYLTQDLYKGSVDLFLKTFARRKLSQFEQHVDFKKMEDTLNQAQRDLKDILKEICKKQMYYLMRDAQKLLDNETYGDIKKLRLKYVGDFKRAIAQAMVKIHLDASHAAMVELGKGRVPVIITNKFAIYPTYDQWEALPPKEAADLFNRKVRAQIVDKDGNKILVDLITGDELSYYNSKAFAISGVEQDYILNGAQKILLEGIKNGDPKGAMENLRDLFTGYVDTGDIPDTLTTEPRLETIVRTNMADAVNHGRQTLFQDSDIKDYVPFVQWSSILDDRTTPYCFLSGTKILMGDGTQKEIQDIGVGETVITGDGSFRKVIKVFERKTNEYLHFMVDNIILKVTPEHPIWDGRRFKKAGAWKTGEAVTNVNVSYLQKVIQKRCVENKEVLFGGMLSGQTNPEQVDTQSMPVVQKGVYGKGLLYQKGTIQVLFTGLSHFLRKKRNGGILTCQGMPEMPQGVQDKTQRGIKGKESEILLQGVPERRNSLRYMSNLWSNYRTQKRGKQASILLQRLLCKITGTFDVRDGCRRGIKGLRDTIYQGISNWRYYNRLCVTADFGGFGSGWNLLAPRWEEGQGKKEQGRDNSSGWVNPNSPTREGSEGGALCNDSEKINILPFYVGKKIHDIQYYAGPVTVYNLQIETNPTYFAEGILVHNCEAMDGRVFRNDDPDFAPPPAHYNCRSTIVPITEYDVPEGGIDTDNMVDNYMPRPLGFTQQESPYSHGFAGSLDTTHYLATIKAKEQAYAAYLRERPYVIPTFKPYVDLMGQEPRWYISVGSVHIPGVGTYWQLPADRKKAEIKKTYDWWRSTNTPDDVIQKAFLFLFELSEQELEAYTNFTYIEYGAASSGNWGHAGRPGEVGGSQPGGIPAIRYAQALEIMKAGNATPEQVEQLKEKMHQLLNRGEGKSFKAIGQRDLRRVVKIGNWIEAKPGIKDVGTIQELRSRADDLLNRTTTLPEQKNIIGARGPSLAKQIGIDMENPKTKEGDLKNEIDSATKIGGAEAGWTSSYFVHLKGDGDGVWKPGEGTMKDGAFEIKNEYTAPAREELAYKVDRMLGNGMVPPTIARTGVGVMEVGGRWGSVQAKAENCTPYNVFSDSHSDTTIHPIDWLKMHMTDQLMSNTDRHGKNFMITNEPDETGFHRIVLIDHGFTFNANYKVNVSSHLRNFMKSYIANEKAVPWNTVEDTVHHYSGFDYSDYLKTLKMPKYAVEKTAMKNINSFIGDLKHTDYVEYLRQGIKARGGR